MKASHKDHILYNCICVKYKCRQIYEKKTDQCCLEVEKRMKGEDYGKVTRYLISFEGGEITPEVDSSDRCILL